MTRNLFPPLRLGAALLALMLSFLALPQVARAQEDGIARGGAAAFSRLSDNAPTFWADGITRIADLDAYKKLGLNTVVVRLTWTVGENGEISAQTLAPQLFFAREAASRGLKIIYALPASPAGNVGAFRISADSQAYVALWSAWLQNAVGALKNTPNLVGWMLPDDPRGLNVFDDAGFERWVGANYASIEVVNRQWDANFAALGDISMDDVSALAATWRGNPTLTGAEIASGKTDITRRISHPDWAFHPGALALATYKWDAYRALLTMWVGAVRGADSGHLVLSGRSPDYAQLLSLPSGVDIAVPDMAPGFAENDIVTHNPQSIDIARRGGKFGVLPMLSPRASANLPLTALPDLSRRWIEEAFSRGARGAGFDSFDNLRQIPGLGAAVSDEIAKLSTAQNAPFWGQAPINTSALILAPLAEGLSAQMDSPQGQTARGLYGFGEDLVEGEPSSLVWSMRWGTAFGGVDYLSPDDLADIPLEKYATIIAPQTLSVSGGAATQLTNYVGNGGVLLADLGIGAAQNGGQANALPPTLTTLFGVPSLFELQSFSFNLNGEAPHPIFPTWSNQIQARPGASLTLGDGPNGAAFAGPVGLSLGSPLASKTGIVLASGPRLARGDGRGNGRIGELYQTGVTVNSVGRGYAVFAPFRLWSDWRPGQVGFDTFWGDLTSRGAAVTQGGATSIVPAPVTQKFGETLFSEVTNHATSVSLANHNAPGGALQLSAVQTSGAGDWLWSNALCSLTPDAAPLAGGRPAPIENASALESRARPATLYGAVEAGEFKTMVMRPIALQNLAGGAVAAQIGEESEKRLKLSAWPDAPGIVAVGSEWQATIGSGAAMRLTVLDAPDGYRVVPRSRHHLLLTTYAGAATAKTGAGAAKTGVKSKFVTSEKIAVADDRGRLVFEFNGAACAIEITPLP